MEAIGLLGMLGITTYEDIHRKEVHSIILLAFAILGMAFHLIFHKLGIYDILGGFAFSRISFSCGRHYPSWASSASLDIL